MVHLHLLHDTKAISAPPTHDICQPQHRGARSPTEAGKLPEISSAGKGEEGVYAADKPECQSLSFTLWSLTEPASHTFLLFSR